MNNHHSAAVLFTVNMQSIARFYEQIVGMSVHRTEDDHIALTKDGFRLVVHKIPDEYAADIQISTPPTIREVSAIKLSLPVDSIAKAREGAARLGGCVYDTDREWEYEGATVCDGWDPDGNVFQLFQQAAS